VRSPAHVLNFEHAFCVLLDEVLFVCVLTVDRVGGSTQIVRARVRVVLRGLSRLASVGSGQAVRVPWENLGERISHFDLAVEGTVELGHLVQGSVLQGTLGRWRVLVVPIPVRQASLEPVSAIYDDGRVLAERSPVLAHVHLSIVVVGRLLAGLLSEAMLAHMADGLTRAVRGLRGPAVG
jgi:hypothetical protein